MDVCACARLVLLRSVARGRAAAGAIPTIVLPRLCPDAAVTCPVGFPAGARGVPSCCVCNLGPAVLLPVVLVALGVVARRVLGFMELVWTPQPASCDSQVYLPNAHSTLHDARQTQMATHPPTAVAACNKLLLMTRQRRRAGNVRVQVHHNALRTFRLPSCNSALLWHTGIAVHS